MTRQKAKGASPPPLPGMTATKVKKTTVTQGDGATLLVAKAAVAPPLVWRPLMPPYYFAVTAINKDGLESDYSNEITFTNQVAISNKIPVVRYKTVNLAWDASTSATSYRVYRGDSKGAYTTNFPCGTNLTLTVPLSRPVAAQGKNLVLTFEGVGFKVSVTNPVGMRLFPGTNMTYKTSRF